MRPHEPGRSSGRATRPQAAAVGRTAGSADGASGRARLDCRQRMAVTWSFKEAGLACAQRKSGRPPLREERTAAAAVLPLPAAKAELRRKGRFLVY